MEKSYPSTKIISIRIPEDELQQVDADARAAGMKRNDYIRNRLKFSNAFVDAESLLLNSDTLRQLEVAQSAYIQFLSRMLDSVEEHPRDQQVAEIYAIATGEIARAKELWELLFRSERRTERLLRKCQRGID